MRESREYFFFWVRATSAWLLPAPLIFLNLHNCISLNSWVMFHFVNSTYSFPVHHMMNIYVVSISRLLWIEQRWAGKNKWCFIKVCSPLGLCLKVICLKYVLYQFPSLMIHRTDFHSSCSSWHSFQQRVSVLLT